MSKLRRLVPFLLLVWITSGLWQAYKPLPEGVGVAMPWREAKEVTFLADRTFLDARGERRSEQEIFDAAFALIAQARRLVLLDMFLFNDFAGAEGHIQRPLSGQLTEALLARMAQQPGLRVVVITDPINTAYGSIQSAQFKRLREAGAELVITDLVALRASNPAWSGPWALCCSWLGNRIDGGWLPNPLGAGRITLRSWLALPNFRANHRKVLVVDQGAGWQALVTSANPHDASSAHDNVALRFAGDAALDLVALEAAVASFSAHPLAGLPSLPPLTPLPDSAAGQLRVLSEGAIGTALLETIAAARPGETLDIAVFYLSGRKVIKALLAAQARGVRLRVLLDPNEDAFGRKKNGVPNRVVARELVAAGIALRWCDTHGEQCHAKFLLHQGEHETTLIVGSANYTRRNLDDLNLETSVQLAAPAGHSAIRAARDWFEECWNNSGGRHYSVAAEVHADDSFGHWLWYRIGEAAGVSTW